MKQNSKGVEIIKDILKVLATGLAITIVLSSPYGSRRLIKNIRHELKNKRLKKEYLLQKFYYLRNKELISFIERDNEIELVLTENGKKQLLKYDFDSLQIKKPNCWDGSWHLVFFDIPEPKRAARDALVRKLRDLGFIKFNNSAWIFPYECQKEIDFISEIFGIGRYIHYLKASYVTNHESLRAKFNI